MAQRQINLLKSDYIHNQLPVSNCHTSSKTFEKEGLPILNSFKAKSAHAYLLEAEQMGTPNANRSDYPCLCYENNKIVTKYSKAIRSNKFLSIMFDCKLIPQKMLRLHPSHSSSRPPGGSTREIYLSN